LKEVGGHVFFDVLDQFLPLTEKHGQTIQDYLNWLQETSKIDIAINKKTNQNLNEEKKRLNEENNKKFWQVFFQVMLILIMAGASIGLIIILIDVSNNVSNEWTMWITIACIISISLSIPLLIRVLAAIKKLDLVIQNHTIKIKSLTQEAWNQMRPLNTLIEQGISAKLMETTFPLIDFDYYFDRKKLDFFANRFGLPYKNDPYRSTLQVQSGNIIGNPFFIAKEKIHYMGKKTYTGTKYISWSTTYMVNGKTQRQYHSQILTASVTKNFPMYYEETYLAYGNDAAPDLSFSRVDSNAEHLSPDQIKAKINDGVKQLEKKAREALKKGQNFTVLSNSEFDVLWGALNRNHEVQFRLLFTPLAQKELLKIMKEKTIGFGDNFNFFKQKKVNVVISEHMQSYDFMPNPSVFFHHDFELFVNNFIQLQQQYFKHLYFAFAPLLSIPLYQQMKTPEYIYQDAYESHASFYEHEKIANTFDLQALKHPKSVTINMMKTQIIRHRDKTDFVEVSAHGYESVQQTDVQVMLGGDGRLHNVVVPWVEYLPVVKRTILDISLHDLKRDVSHSWQTSSQELKARLSK